jgi:hypothetical protein
VEFIASRAADLLAIYATLPDYLLSWRLYSVLVLCLPLETVFVVRKRAILSVGLLQDFVVRAAKRWFFIPVAAALYSLLQGVPRGRVSLSALGHRGNVAPGAAVRRRVPGRRFPVLLHARPQAQGDVDLASASITLSSPGIATRTSASVS